MTALALIAVGFAAGAVAAALGVGGGIVYVPALAALFSFTQHEAQATSLAVIVPTTLVATMIHARAGRVDWRAAAMLAAGGIGGGMLGAAAALATDAALLQRMFAVFLVFAAVRMLGRTRRRND